MANWIYSVLSLVRTSKELFLLTPPPMNLLDKFELSWDLEAVESQMRELEGYMLEAWGRNMAALDNNFDVNIA